MKILMLTPYLPYPDSSGGQIRTQNLLKHLKKDHDITLFSLIKDPSEKKHIPLLEKQFCKKVYVFQRSQTPFTLKNIFRTGFSGLPFLVVRNFSPEAKQAIARELSQNKYDLIHVETFYAMPHIPKTEVPVVLVDQTIEFKVYLHHVQHTAALLLKPLMYLDVAKLMYWERYYWRQADRVIAVSAEDRQEMLKYEPALDVDIVPNGVNLDFFKKRTNWKTKNPTLLFVSNFTWLQNTEAAKILIDKVLPLVQKKIPTARVLIVGQFPPTSLLQKAGPDVIIKEVSVEDTESIKNAYFEADVFVTPLRGPGGTRLKNLAAMASGLPIVSSSVGMGGLGVTPGIHALIEDDALAMAAAIVKLSQDHKKAEKIAKAASQFVKENYDYQQIAAKLSQIYQSVKKQSDRQN